MVYPHSNPRHQNKNHIIFLHVHVVRNGRIRPRFRSHSSGELAAINLFNFTINTRADTHIYTQTKVKQHHIFFGDTVLEVEERNIWVMEIKYSEFYSKFYYF